MRYSKKEKLVISMLLIFGIISLLTLSLTHVITGVFGNKLDLVLNNKIVSRLQIIHVTANYFLFISLICILFCIIKGFVAGCYQKLKNSHGIFLIFFTVLFIILYCPFYFHLLEPNDPDSVVLWYFINFLCISYLFIILMFLENKISSKSGDNKVFSLITHSFEMNIETDKKLYIFSVKELYMLYALSIILIICFVLLSVVLIRLPGIEQHYNNMYYISKHFKYSFLNPGYSIRWIAFICLVILLYLNVNAFWKSSIYHIKKTIIIFLPTIFFMITYITIFWPSSCLAPLTALGWFLIYFLGIFLLIMMIIACRYLSD
ncbi:MAG: hypothetical protein GY756_14425, partial [bacterium]|nr:hypothetical protein [bacterium]